LHISCVVFWKEESSRKIPPFLPRFLFFSLFLPFLYSCYWSGSSAPTVFHRTRLSPPVGLILRNWRDVFFPCGSPWADKFPFFTRPGMSLLVTLKLGNLACPTGDLNGPSFPLPRFFFFPTFPKTLYPPLRFSHLWFCLVFSI